MLDIKLIREQPEVVRSNLKKRNDPEKLKLLEELIKNDKKWRDLIAEINTLRQKRNEISKRIAEAKKEKKDVKKLLKEAEKIPQEIKKIEDESNNLEQKIRDALLRIPNLLHESVPVGKDESENVEIRRWGKQPKFDFQPKDHLEILQNLGLIDEERGSKVAGRGFFYLKKELVLLDYALLRYTIDFMLKKGYILIEPTFMLRKEAFEGATDLENLKQQIYKIDGEDLYMIGTAEHSLASMFMNETLNAKDLPLKLVGISPCFRKEVGAHGKYTKGLFRMHQFIKVEQFIFCKPEDAWKMFDELQRNSEEILQNLGIHYRVMTLCSGDTGIVAAKTNDNEIWMADGKFREVGSNSNCTDYQARRLNIKFREKEGQPAVGFVHTLNNTGVATSRVMVAIIEQNQQKDGSVIIPEVLRSYMNGIKKLEKK